MAKDRIHRKNIRLASGTYKKCRRSLKNTAATPRDFSHVEDTAAAYRTINEITSRAGRSAAFKRKKAGLSGIFIRNDQLIAVTPNGVEKVISTKPAHANSFYVNYKPSTVLHAVKK